jgi:hypothetical protein
VIYRIEKTPREIPVWEKILIYVFLNPYRTFRLCKPEISSFISFFGYNFDLFGSDPLTQLNPDSIWIRNTDAKTEYKIFFQGRTFTEGA